MAKRVYHVQAHWDHDAKVWWVESDDVPGLVAEDADYGALIATVQELVPELLRDNLGIEPSPDDAISIVSDREEPLRATA